MMSWIDLLGFSLTGAILIMMALGIMNIYLLIFLFSRFEIRDEENSEAGKLKLLNVWIGIIFGVLFTIYALIIGRKQFIYIYIYFFFLISNPLETERRFLR